MSEHVDTVGAVAQRLSAALRVPGLISRRNKYLYSLQVVVPGLAVCVREFYMLVNAPTLQELTAVRGYFFFLGPAGKIINMTNLVHGGKRERETVSLLLTKNPACCCNCP